MDSYREKKPAENGEKPGRIDLKKEIGKGLRTRVEGARAGGSRKDKTTLQNSPSKRKI